MQWMVSFTPRPFSLLRWRWTQKAHPKLRFFISIYKALYEDRQKSSATLWGLQITFSRPISYLLCCVLYLCSTLISKYKYKILCRSTIYKLTSIMIHTRSHNHVHRTPTTKEWALEQNTQYDRTLTRRRTSECEDGVTILFPAPDGQTMTLFQLNIPFFRASSNHFWAPTHGSWDFMSPNQLPR